MNVVLQEIGASEWRESWADKATASQKPRTAYPFCVAHSRFRDMTLHQEKIWHPTVCAKKQVLRCARCNRNWL